MTELKRCPFCGTLPHTEVYINRKKIEEDYIIFEIHCPKCDTNKKIELKINRYCHYTDVEKAMRKAIDKWNERNGD